MFRGRTKSSSKVQQTPRTVPYSRASSITSMPAPALPDEVVHFKFQERCYDQEEGPMQINGNKSKGIIFNQCDEDEDNCQIPCQSFEKAHYANLGKPTEICQEEAMLIDRNKSKEIIYKQCDEDEHIYQIPCQSFEKPHYANLDKPTESCEEEGMLIDENKSKEIIYEQCDEEDVYHIPCFENPHYANLGKPSESCYQELITSSRDSSIMPYGCSRPYSAQIGKLNTVSESSFQEPPSEASIAKEDSDRDRLLYDDVVVYLSLIFITDTEPVAAETSLINDECNMEGRSSSRKRPRKQYNIKVKGNGIYAIGPKARIVENHSLTDVCRSSLENFNAFLKTVEASRGPEDQIECSVLTEILPFVESNHIRKGGGCNDSLEILAKLGSPTLKRPRIAKHVLKLLNKLVFIDIGRGITNAGLVETHRCLSQSIADGSFSGELCHDQRRRAEVYCNVLVAMTIGRTRGHFAYPQSETDKKEIELCITGTETILRCWSLPRKYRKRLSLEMILSLLKRSLKRTSIHERLKQLLDRCELMIEDAFVEEDVSFLLNEVRCAEHGQLDLFIIAKMLHAKMKNQPSTKAYQIFKNITTNHALFSPSWTMKRDRYDWHFVLLACQIFLDVTTNHNVKATRLDAAEMLTSFRDIKAYAKSMVVCNIVEKYITKATFAFDVESRQYLMAKRHEDEEKISLDLLRKQICAVHATGYLEIVEKICQTENHMLMRGTFLDKPVTVKAKSISYSRLVASHNDKVYATERFIENQTSIWRYLSREANVHVPLLHADDTNKFPNHYIMEYAENGDLRRYLLSRRERNTPSYREALQICLASAKSIYFVHQKYVVHNHLRAEHLLVGSNHHCIKVSGFSRARRQSSKIEFEKEFKVEILNSDDPSIRWTAPWGLQNDGALCCSRSDIWAFGVVMYEIITCGGLPYADKSLEKVRNDVLAGLNLSKEQHVKDGYYSIMQRCFGTESISFSQICSELQKLIDQCAVEDDRPMVIPENISTVYKPINEEVQQNSTQEFCKPFPANKTIENLSTVYKPINEVVQQNRTQVFGRPFPVNETQSKVSLSNNAFDAYLRSYNKIIDNENFED
ncbi:Tyrosine kinase receptor Cad96Ca [Exaiptasia diaphana]|nr:Tyrosine kinase receptor Cad96Ca [Exaiptasia diaphana]